MADPRVDAYIDALPDWQQAICQEVRELAQAAAGSGRRLGPAPWIGAVLVVVVVLVASMWQMRQRDVT
jgi:hypothetical protein